MSDTTTPVYSFVLPEIDGSDGTWGTKLNANLTALDGLLSGSANLQNASFTGTASFGGSTGTAGQVLKSQGAGANAIWTDDSNTTYTAGSGLSLTGTEFANTAPDQTVVLTGAGATSISGTYPNFTITSTNTTYSVGDGGLTEINFTSADNTKLDGIEASADVTDTANVTAAGALMDSELTSEASVKALDQGVATTDSPAFVNLTLSGTGSVKVPSGTTAQRDGSPANGMFRYNSTTEEFEGYSDGEWGSIGGGGGGSNLNIDTMTGDGSDTTLTLSINPTVENNTQVYIDGVYQNKDTYSVSGTTLTFSTAPPTGSAVEVMTITPTALLVPADGSVTPAKIASGDFYFDTNTLYVDSTNNRVGIGTSSPSSLLHLSSAGSTVLNVEATGANDSRLRITSGNSNTSYVEFADPDDADTGEIRYEHATNNMQFRTAGNVERMRIDSSGQVGIGTASPERILHLKQAVPCVRFEDTDASGVYHDILSEQNTGFCIRVDEGNVASGSYFKVDIDDSEKMRIDSSGQVGIGTSSPEATLHIADIGSTGPALHIAGGSATEGDITTPHNETLQIGHWNESSNAFTERMRIDTSGSVGLRTTANVVSSTSGEGAWLSSGGYLAIAREGTTTSHPALYLNQTGVTGQLVQFRKDGTSVGSISTNGSSLPSDRNFKRNIESLDLGLDFVASLNPVTYNYKLDEEGQPVMTGLIAQEVEESLTAAGVEKNSMTLLQHTPTDDVKESDYQMDYLKLVPILINSIKEQQTLIESLTDRIAALEE
jgi:hypothetical protein